MTLTLALLLAGLLWLALLIEDHAFRASRRDPRTEDSRRRHPSGRP